MFGTGFRLSGSSSSSLEKLHLIERKRAKHNYIGVSRVNANTNTLFHADIDSVGHTAIKYMDSKKKLAHII